MFIKNKLISRFVLMTFCSLAAATVVSCSKDDDDDLYGGYYDDYDDYYGSGSGGSGSKTPSNVKATSDGTNITIQWNNMSGVDFYEVARSSSSIGSFSIIGTSYTNYYVDRSPLQGANYYKVRANIDGSYGGYSSIVQASLTDNSSGSGNSGNGNNTGNGNDDTGNNNQGSGSASQKPSVPTGLRAVQNGESIVVSWNAVSNAYYYRLWYSTPSGQEDFTNVYAPSTSEVFDQNMKDGTYTFWIQALNSNYDESAKSSKVSCNFKSSSNGNTGNNSSQSKLDTPKNLEAYSASSYVQISFDQVSLAYQYELYRSTSASSGYTKITATGGSISGNRYVLTDQNPKSGTSYYKVKAIALSSLGIADSDLSSYVKVTR